MAWLQEASSEAERTANGSRAAAHAVRHAGVEAVVLFGSRSTGTSPDASGSDVCFVVAANHETFASCFWRQRT